MQAPPGSEEDLSALCAFRGARFFLGLDGSALGTSGPVHQRTLCCRSLNSRELPAVSDGCQKQHIAAHVTAGTDWGTGTLGLQSSLSRLERVQPGQALGGDSAFSAHKQLCPRPSCECGHTWVVSADISRRQGRAAHPGRRLGGLVLLAQVGQAEWQSQVELQLGGGLRLSPVLCWLQQRVDL